MRSVQIIGVLIMLVMVVAFYTALIIELAPADAALQNAPASWGK